MALFGKDKPRKLCPLCGNPAARFLPTKVEDQPLCDDCAVKMNELSGDFRNSVMASLDSVREYISVFDANQLLRSSFRETYRHEFGLFGGCIRLDTEQRILRLGGSDNAFAYEPETIISFRIMEDSTPLFECTQEGMVCYYSAVPEKVRNLGPEIDRYLMELRQAEHLQRMEEQMERHAEQNGQTYIKNYISEPDVGRLNPFRKYYISIELEHPYRRESKEFKKDAPGFNAYSPSIDAYLASYEEAYYEMRDMAENVMAVINPDAPVREEGGPAAENSGSRAMPVASAPTVDPVEEIQRYKALLDSGVITEEEFTAKKRQLMGI